MRQDHEHGKQIAEERKVVGMSGSQGKVAEVRDTGCVRHRNTSIALG